MPGIRIHFPLLAAFLLTGLLLPSLVRAQFPPGNVYVAGSRMAKVYEYDSAFNYLSEWTHPALGQVLPVPGQSLELGPGGMAFDSAGNLVVAGRAEICVFSAPGQVQACYPKISAELTEHLIFDSEGNLYTTTATGGSNNVQKYDRWYNFVTSFPLPTGELTGITCDEDHLYVASQTCSCIYKLDKQTLGIVDIINGAGYVEGIQIADDGNLWTSLPNYAVNTPFGGLKKIVPSSPYQVLDSITHPALFRPHHLTIDNAGNLYSVDWENSPVGATLGDLFKFDSTGQVLDSLVPTGIYGPFAIVVAGTQLTCGAYGNVPYLPCPSMTVDIGTWALRPCQTVTYYGAYCNMGGDTAYQATVDIRLDTAQLSYVNASIPLLSTTGVTYTFDLGDVPPGFCGGFSLEVYVDCDTALIGQTACVEAHIFPDSLCPTGQDTVWDRSSVVVNGGCQGDSLVCFVIGNTGDPGNGNMLAPSEYRIYEDSLLVYTGQFQLCGGCDTTICWPATGATIRLEADQRPGHPGNSHPNDVVEACGDSLNPSLGMVNLFPMDDADPFVEIDCQPILAPVDPNDKLVVPAGVGPAHLTDRDALLEYTLRFQNTGTDTAFDVVLLDTLSPFLDLSTLSTGISSFPYTSVLDSATRELRLSFIGIQLPDSSTDEAGSQGFVRFKIRPLPGLADGSRIDNRAGIIFDFQPPVLTETVFNTIGDPRLTTLPAPIHAIAGRLLLYPNPSTGSCTVDLGAHWQQPELWLYDLQGRLLRFRACPSSSSIVLDLSDLPVGSYLIRVRDRQGRNGSGMLLKAQ